MPNEATLNICQNEATLNICQIEATLNICQNDATLNICQKKATLNICQNELVKRFQEELVFWKTKTLKKRFCSFFVSKQNTSF